MNFWGCVSCFRLCAAFDYTRPKQCVQIWNGNVTHTTPTAVRTWEWLRAQRSASAVRSGSLRFSGFLSLTRSLQPKRELREPLRTADALRCACNHSHVRTAVGVVCVTFPFQIWTHWTKNNNASRIQSAVWSCSSALNRIFYVSMWQWMKHGSTTTHLKQKDRQLSSEQLVKAVQSDQKLNSGLARLWHPYFGKRMVFCSSTILRKVKPLTASITWHYWIDWAQKSRKSSFIWKRKNCCSTKSMLRATSP